MKRVDVDIAVIARDGKVLICQRKAGATFGGVWEFPGGKREPGETPEQCLARELREELAIHVHPVERLEPIEHDYPNLHVRLHPHLCLHVEGEPRPIECQQAIWIAPPALRDYPFPPANEQLVERAIHRLTAGGIRPLDRDRHP